MREKQADYTRRMEAEFPMKKYKTLMCSVDDPCVVIDTSRKDDETVAMRIEDYLSELSKEGWSLDGFTATGHKDGYATEFAYVVSRDETKNEA